GARVVALIGGCAENGVAARAPSVLSSGVLSAGVPVVAGAPVGLRRVRARPRGRATCARLMALVGGFANNGVAARADAVLAGVGRWEERRVGTGGGVGLWRVRGRGDRGAGGGVVG